MYHLKPLQSVTAFGLFLCCAFCIWAQLSAENVLKVKWNKLKVWFRSVLNVITRVLIGYCKVWMLRWAGSLQGPVQDEPPIVERTGNTSHVEQGRARSMSTYTQKHTQTSTRLNLTSSTECLQNHDGEFGMHLTNMPPLTLASLTAPHLCS